MIPTGWFGGDYWRQTFTEFRPSCNYFTSLCPSCRTKTGYREKAGQTAEGWGVGGAEMLWYQMKGLLKPGNWIREVCENSWVFSQILFSVQVFRNIEAETLCNCVMFMSVEGEADHTASLYTPRLPAPGMWKCSHTLPHTHITIFAHFSSIKYTQVVVASSGRREFKLHWHSWHSLSTDLHTSPACLHMALSIKTHTTHTHIRVHPTSSKTVWS